MNNKVARSILLAVVVAACGTAGPASTEKDLGATQKPGGGTTVDCAKLRVAAGALIGLQWLAQMTTPESVETVRTISSFDLNGLISALGDLHALDSISTPLGSAKASIDAYEKAAKAAKVLLAMNPVTQAAIDTYNKENVGSVADFLGKQVAISGAMSQAGC